MQIALCTFYIVCTELMIRQGRQWDARTFLLCSLIMLWSIGEKAFFK